MKIAMCPSCNCSEVSTTWINHQFQYGVDEDPVMLACKVPLRTCLQCSEEWLDHVGEDIIAEVVEIHLRSRCWKVSRCPSKR
jgi:hypothetical protein